MGGGGSHGPILWMGCVETGTERLNRWPRTARLGMAGPGLCTHAGTSGALLYQLDQSPLWDPGLVPAVELGHYPGDTRGRKGHGQEGSAVPDLCGPARSLLVALASLPPAGIPEPPFWNRRLERGSESLFPMASQGREKAWGTRLCAHICTLVFTRGTGRERPCAHKHAAAPPLWGHLPRHCSQATRRTNPLHPTPPTHVFRSPRKKQKQTHSL